MYTNCKPKKSEFNKMIKIYLILLILCMASACSLKSSNFSKEKIILEDGSEYNFNIDDGIYFEYDKLSYAKQLDYKVKKDGSLGIYAKGEEGLLEINVNNKGTTEEIHLSGKEEETKNITLKEGQVVEIEVKADNHKGSFSIEVEY
ncbi:hypothetical protein [Lagierella sp.]|uniref:hypothetical protein n=1 Tax=Lagierella sp. TaxID=2849657 RepID=UPI0026270ACB|nr:hypothetical protein [Lagierella sp.]